MSNITTLMPNPKMQFLSSLGTPLLGGKVYTYAAGTTNPKATYTDAAGTVVQPNPIPLNLRGEPDSPIFWSGSYYVEVRDRLGNLIYSVDNFNTDPAGLWNIMTNLAASAGAGLIGYILTAAGAIKRTLQQKADEFPSLADFGAKGDGNTDDTAAIQKAINKGGIIWCKAGTYMHGTLDFKGKSVVFVGDGEDKTIFKANRAALMFDVQETTDQPGLPLVFKNIKLDGGSIATGGTFTRYRHKTEFVSVTITNINGDCLNELDAWNNIRRNLTLTNSVNGLVLQGADNNTRFSGISISGMSSRLLDIQNGGTVAGGSTALSFNNCDFEYSSGDGVRINTHGVVRFNDCYIGEQIQGKVFDMVSGMAVMNGGFAYFGTTATSYLGNLGGGKLYFKNVNITGGAVAAVNNMFVGGNGRAYVEDSPCYITVTSPEVMTGDVLDYGRTFECFAPKLGRLYTSFTLNGTNTSTSTANEITVTCATVTGAPCIMEVKAQVTEGWLRGRAGSLIVVYSSQKDLIARLTNGSVGITPDDNIGTLPATGGQLKTAVLFDWVYNNNDTPWLEVFQLNTVVGDSFTIEEVFLYDAKQGKADSAATFYNLGKA